MNKHFLFSVFILFFISSCKENDSFFEEVAKRLPYLQSQQIIDSLNQETLSSQLCAIKSCDIGDHKNALKYWDQNLNENNFQPSKLKVKGNDTRNTIVQEAERYNWLIINEQHHNSHHRVTFELLLKDLFKQGYRNLGMEQLANDSILNDRGYPISISSKYYQDPQLFNAIRTALDIGFYVFPYDYNCNESGYPREECEASNILQRVKTKEGKTIIYCGYDHAVEGEHRSWGNAMAGILRKELNEDILTINQTYFSEHSTLSFASPFYKSIHFDKSVIISDPDSLLLPRLESNFYPYDLYIYHPMTNYMDDHPTWLLRDNYKKVKVELPKSINAPYLVFAFNVDEKHAKAVPVDITEVKEPKEYTTLFVPTGKTIEYVAKDVSGNTHTLQAL